MTAWALPCSAAVDGFCGGSSCMTGSGCVLWTCLIHDWALAVGVFCGRASCMTGHWQWVCSVDIPLLAVNGGTLL